VSIALAAVLWGTIGVTTKLLYGLAATNPLSIGFFRLGLAAPLVTAAAWAHLGRRTFAIAPRDLLRLTLVGAMLAFYQVCYFAAIAQTGVVLATLVTLCTAPVLVGMIGVALTRERLPRSTIVALGSALAGTALLMVGPPETAPHAAATVAGVVLALGSATGYAVMAVISRALAARYHPLQVTGLGFVAGAALLLPLALAGGLAIRYPPQGWLLLAGLGLVPTAGGHLLFQAGMRTTPATSASILTLLEPVTATILAWVIFGERLGPWGLPGTLLLLAALAVLYRGAT
jgi:DME family drug/metabolite transporter